MTDAPIASHFAGMILDDVAQEFNPLSPQFGEKWAPPFVPVSIRDYNGEEISRVYSDQWGRINGLMPSTFTANMPSPSGFSPAMHMTCMNDPGPIPVPGSTTGETMVDPQYNPAYSNFCYTFQYMPGATTYLDTPVLPVSAFASGYNPPDCSLDTGTPMIHTVEDLEFDCRNTPPADFAERVASVPDTALVLWLAPEHLAGIADTLPSSNVYLSSTLLAGEFNEPVLSMPGQVFVAHPFRLPGQSDPALRRFSVWAKTRGIELNAPRRQSEAFFACLALKDAIAHMGRFFIRDYALDTLDHAQSLVAYLPFYPRPTLGPQQRFMNKGGYVLPIENGQVVTEEAAWILP